MVQDFRFGMRLLLQQPGFTAIAVITLGLGIGSSAAVFNLIEGVLLTPPPYRQLDRLVLISAARTDGRNAADNSGWSAAHWQEWQKQAHSVDGIAAYGWTFNFLVQSDGSESMGACGSRAITSASSASSPSSDAPSAKMKPDRIPVGSKYASPRSDSFIVTILIRHANNSWALLLAYVTGLVNQRLLLQCEYLIAENRVLRSHVSANLRLSDSERRTLAEIGKSLGRKLLSDVACVAKPETILGWYRRLIARKFDGSARGFGRDRSLHSARGASWSWLNPRNSGAAR